MNLLLLLLLWWFFATEEGSLLLRRTTYSRQWLQESEMRLGRQSSALPELKGRSPYARLLLTLPEAGCSPSRR